MNVVDSSCWLEYFSGSKTGEQIAPILENVEKLVVPSIWIYEVIKKLLVEVDEDRAIFAAAHMKQGDVVELDSDLAMYAAKVGKEFRLATMAERIIYATAKKYNARLYTQDKHFRELDNVEYFEK